MRRRQKPRNPEPFTTTIFITAPSFLYVKSAAAQKGDSQRHNNHSREKQHQLYGTKASNCKPQSKGDGMHSPASGKSGAGIGTAYFPHLESPPFPYRLFYCIQQVSNVCRLSNKKTGAALSSACQFIVDIRVVGISTYRPCRHQRALREQPEQAPSCQQPSSQWSAP